MHFDRRSFLCKASGAALTSVAGITVCHPLSALASTFTPPAGPRARMVYLNDLSGDIDGLFATVHMALSPSIDLRAIVGTSAGGEAGKNNSAQDAANIASEMLAKMALKGKIKVHTGSAGRLSAPKDPMRSEGTQAIIDEAMRTDSQLPLFVTVGGGLTEVASAVMLEPSIADRFTLVWIGGGRPHPEGANRENNFGVDPLAAQYVYNETHVPLWQVPSEVYQTCVISDTELLAYVAPCGEIGKYLYEKLIGMSTMFKAAFNTGETWTLGDSPLVLLTALNDWVPSASKGPRGPFEYRRTGSSRYEEIFAPQLDSNGAALPQTSGRKIRLYSSVDTRLMFSDFFAKLQMNFPR